MVKAVQPSRAVSIWKEKSQISGIFAQDFFQKIMFFSVFFMWIFVVPSLEFSHVVSHDTVDNGQSCNTSDGFFNTVMFMYIFTISTGGLEKLSISMT